MVPPEPPTEVDGSNQTQLRNRSFPAEIEVEVATGGAERDRTVDLLNAIQALSQLSYSPTREGAKNSTAAERRESGTRAGSRGHVSAMKAFGSLHWPRS